MERKHFMSIFLLVFVGAVNCGKHDIYSGFSVYGVKLKNEADHHFLHKLENDLGLDVWEHGRPGLKDALVMVKPEEKLPVLRKLDENNLDYYVHMADVAKTLREQDAEMNRWVRSRREKLMVFENYPRHDEVNEYLEKVASEHPDIVTLVDAGPSYEGRRIKYLKISTTNFNDDSKPIYFMDAMIHAREWVTTPVTLYAIHRLVENLSDQDRDLLETVDWIILPVVNPDGYEYTHTDVRLWRRTRSFYPEQSDACYGVDANRNFDVAFNTVGISSDPCSDIFPGYEPFSEPETRIVRDIIHDNLSRMQLYMNIHSYGNWILYGYGDRTLPSNVVHLHQVGAAMGAAMDTMKLPEADFYTVGNSAILLYSTSGSAQDYGQAVGVPFSYTLELPGFGTGFQVPPQYIDHVNRETWLGIAASARLARLYYTAQNANKDLHQMLNFD